MRVLLIEEDPHQRAAIQHRLLAHRPETQIVVRDPCAQGSLAPEFLATGFDAVLLASTWSRGGRGLEWLQELAGRPGFAPVVFLATQAEDCDGRAALRLGAHAALGHDEVAGEPLLRALDSAAHAQSRARAQWHASEAGRAAQRFGCASIRGYRRIRQIAAGPIAELYLAESEAMDALVVLKVARDHHQDRSDLDHTFRRFLQEYEIVQRIRHPGVVRLHDLRIGDEHAWLVMEYFGGGDLRRRMKSGILPQSALCAALGIARALEATHAAGVLHRDLKPGNVMFRDDGSLALIDFGLSKDLAHDLEVTDHGMIFGTPHYMSPEQGHGEPIDPRSDLYSLGVMLFEMLTHEKPFVAENPMAIIYKHRKEPVPRLPERLADLQPMLERFLAKQASDRYASAADAAAALEEASRMLRHSGLDR